MDCIGLAEHPNFQNDRIASTASERGRLKVLRNQQHFEGATRAPINRIEIGKL